MPLKVICPSCSAKLKVPEALAGQTVRCVRCRNSVPVPEQDTPWSALDQGDSVNEVVPPKPIPTGKLVTSRRSVAAAPPPAPAPVAPPPALVSSPSEDNPNPFAFGDLTPLPDALRAVKGEAPATLPEDEDALERRRRRAKAKSGKGMVGLAVGVGTAAAVVLTVAVVVFVIRNSHNESPGQKPGDKAVEASTPSPTGAAAATTSVADSAARSAKSAGKPLSARTAQTSSRRAGTTAPARAAPIDPDNPPDPGKGPIPVPLGGGPKAKDGDSTPAKPGDKDKKDEKQD